MLGLRLVGLGFAIGLDLPSYSNEFGVDTNENQLKQGFPTPTLM